MSWRRLYSLHGKILLMGRFDWASGGVTELYSTSPIPISSPPPNAFSCVQVSLLLSSFVAPHIISFSCFDKPGKKRLLLVHGSNGIHLVYGRRYDMSESCLQGYQVDRMSINTQNPTRNCHSHVECNMAHYLPVR